MFKLETLEGFLEPVTTQNSCIQTLKQPFNSRTSRTHQLIFKVWLFSSYSDIINQKSNSKINLSGITCGTKRTFAFTVVTMNEHFGRIWYLTLFFVHFSAQLFLCFFTSHVNAFIANKDYYYKQAAIISTLKITGAGQSSSQHFLHLSL